jgi:hypothetical protein
VNRTFDDVKFGNSGVGSTDFSAGFATDIVPPFDLTDERVEITSTQCTHNSASSVARLRRYDVLRFI